MPLPDLQALINPRRLERVQSMALTQPRDTSRLNRLTRLTARLLNAPAAFVSVVDADRQIFLAHTGLPGQLAARRELPLTHSFCSHAVATGEAVVTSDARLDPRLVDNGLVTEYGVVAYAGSLLTPEDGISVGALCVIDFEPRQWSDGDLTTLGDLAQAVLADLQFYETELARRKVDEERSSTEQFLRQVLDASPDIIYLYNLSEGSNEYNNPELLNVLGYTPEQLSTMESGAVARLMHPDDLAALRERNKQLTGAAVGTMSENEFRMLHADGNYRWLRARETIVETDADGNPARLLGVAQDITRRRQMEAAQRETVQRLTLMRRVDIELLRTLDLQGAMSVAMDAALRVTNASDAFIGLIEGENLRIAYVSGSYERDTLLPLNGGVIGRALRSGRPELLQDVSAEPAYVAHLPGTRAQMVLPLVYRDRAVGVMVLDSRRTDRLTADTFEFMKLIIDRITVSIENALLYQLSQDRLAQVTELYDRVRQLEQLKTDMIRLAAHDLRSPLNVIGMHCDLLLENDGLSASQRRALEDTRDSARKMTRIVTDILSLQRIESMDNVSQEAVSMAELVELVASSHRARARAKQLAFSVLLPGSSVIVEADPMQIREALDNLIDNAIKYTPQGGSVTVRLGERGGLALVEVEDTGPGIPDEMQPRVFSPFFRTRSAETITAEGTGLGLHLVKNIIERHNGRMRFHSTFGRGSMFGFEMPSVRTGVLKPVSQA
jgi:PAS domain S-box-containing protein